MKKEQYDGCLVVWGATIRVIPPISSLFLWDFQEEEQLQADMNCLAGPLWQWLEVSQLAQLRWHLDGCILFAHRPVCA